jgi:hypothetical protein
LEKAQFVIHFILKILYFIPSICLFAQQFGRLPIELAAEYGTWEDVELLFPVTSKIPTVADWSVNGVISHIHGSHATRGMPSTRPCIINSYVHIHSLYNYGHNFAYLRNQQSMSFH